MCFRKKPGQSPYSLIPLAKCEFICEMRALHQLSHTTASLALLFTPAGSLREVFPRTQPCARCKAERLETKQSQGENNLLLQPHTSLPTSTGKTFILGGEKLILDV